MSILYLNWLSISQQFIICFLIISLWFETIISELKLLIFSAKKSCRKNPSFTKHQWRNQICLLGSWHLFQKNCSALPYSLEFFWSLLMLNWKPERCPHPLGWDQTGLWLLQHYSHKKRVWGLGWASETIGNSENVERKTSEWCQTNHPPLYCGNHVNLKFVEGISCWISSLCTCSCLLQVNEWRTQQSPTMSRYGSKSSGVQCWKLSSS